MYEHLSRSLSLSGSRLKFSRGSGAAVTAGRAICFVFFAPSLARHTLIDAEATSLNAINHDAAATAAAAAREAERKSPSRRFIGPELPAD